MVVGDEGTNGGLWCSPVANTSSPTSSALTAIATMALMRSASVGVVPVVGSVVTSPTVKIPNCMAGSSGEDANWLTGQLPSTRFNRTDGVFIPAHGVCQPLQGSGQSGWSK